MENKLELRVGDVVRLKPLTVTGIFGDDTILFNNIFRVSSDRIESIISRAETPQETIARLKAELAEAPRRIEWDGGECPVDNEAQIVAWLNTGRTRTRLAKYFRWDYMHGANNLIAYMVLPS